MSFAQFHPVRSGLRDVLPSEFREVRAISEKLREVFTNYEYQELRTPALEEPDVVERGPAGRSAYRVVDEHGHALALRADMTVPIARLVAARYREVEEPLRFSYLAPVYKAIHPKKAQAREILQAGVELLGMPAPDGTVEVLTVLDQALAALGCRNHVIGFNDATFVTKLLEVSGVDTVKKERVQNALAAGDFVALASELSGLQEAETVVNLLRTRVKANSLNDIKENFSPEVLALFEANQLSDIIDRLPQSVKDHTIVDFSLTRNLGYYSGPVFEIYAPGIGKALGGGGHYDDLLGHFGHNVSAVGFALDVDLLHKVVNMTGSGG